MSEEKSLGKLLPPQGLHQPKNSYVKLKFGSFTYKGDVVFLSQVIDEALRLREEVDLTVEPEEVAKVYG